MLSLSERNIPRFLIRCHIKNTGNKWKEGGGNDSLFELSLWDETDGGIFLNELRMSELSSTQLPTSGGSGTHVCACADGGQQKWRCSEELRVSSCDSAAAFLSIPARLSVSGPCRTKCCLKQQRLEPQTPSVIIYSTHPSTLRWRSPSERYAGVQRTLTLPWKNLTLSIFY